MILRRCKSDQRVRPVCWSTDTAEGRMLIEPASATSCRKPDGQSSGPDDALIRENGFQPTPQDNKAARTRKSLVTAGRPSSTSLRYPSDIPARMASRRCDSPAAFRAFLMLAPIDLPPPGLFLSDLLLVRRRWRLFRCPPCPPARPPCRLWPPDKPLFFAIYRIPIGGTINSGKRHRIDQQ